MISNIMLY